MAQIFCQSAPYIRRKGQPLVTIDLAAHAVRARAPVDVVEPESGDLDAPQAEADQPGQNCQIADANNCADIAGSENLPHLIGRESLGQSGQSAAQDGRHDRAKRALRDAFQMQKIEERTPRRDSKLRYRPLHCDPKQKQGLKTLHRHNHHTNRKAHITSSQLCATDEAWMVSTNV